MYFDSIELQKIFLYNSAGLPHNFPFMLPEKAIKVVELTLGHMRLEMTAYILAKREEDWIVTYPRDWWEAFKERWLHPSSWLLKRWPVLYTERVAEVYSAYPTLKFQGEEHTTVVHIPLAHENVREGRR